MRLRTVRRRRELEIGQLDTGGWRATFLPARRGSSSFLGTTITHLLREVIVKLNGIYPIRTTRLTGHVLVVFGRI